MSFRTINKKKLLFYHTHCIYVMVCTQPNLHIDYISMCIAKKKVQCIETSEYQMNVCFRGTEYVRLRQRSWGKFFISRDVLGKRAGGKNRRWGKFLEITEHSAPLVCLMSLF